jgi:hypothetical protein
VVHCARTGQGPQVPFGKVITIVAVPRWATGFQALLAWPCGQVACSAAKSMAKAVRSNPAPALACGEVTGQHRGDQRDAEVGQRRYQQLRRGITRVHVVLGRPQAPPGQAGMDRRGHLVIGHGRVRGLHVHDQMRGRGSLTVAAVTFAAGAAARGGVVQGGASAAGLGDVHLAAVPESVTLDAPPGIKVIRRGDPGSARREALRLRLPPFDHLPSSLAGDGEVVLQEHDPQHPGLVQPRQERQIRITAGGGVHRFQQGAAVAAVSQRQLVFLRRGGGHPPGADPGGVPFAPRVVQELRHHLRRGHRQGLQAGPDRLPGQLQPVQVAYRGDHVGGIGAHLPAGRHQPARGQPLQQRAGTT